MPKKANYPVPVDSTTIGKRLVQLRRQRGLTQVELAKKLSLTQALVSDYERGKLRLHGGLIVAFAKALKVSTDEILGLKKSGRDGYYKERRFLRRIPKIEKLSRRDKEALLSVIDAFLSKVQD